MSNRTITALLEHKFDVSKMESVGADEDVYGPVVSVVHNNINLTFQLSIRPNDTRGARKNHLGLYILYVGGPSKVLMMSYALFVAKGSERDCVILSDEPNEFKATNIHGTKRSGWGSGLELPGSLDGLRRQGYLCHDSILHASAILFIPEDAFSDPTNKCPISSAQNSFFHDLYLQTGTPISTKPPSIRFEIISNDGHHCWVHRQVLAFNSEEFGQMFDPEKPADARFNYLREGRMTLKNVCGCALNEMITYLYLQHTTPEFDNFAMELLPVSEMYGLSGLALLCVQTLADQAKNEKNVGSLLHLLEFAQLHKLKQLEEKSVKRLEQVVMQQNNIERHLLLNVTEQAHNHGYVQLKNLCQKKLVQHVNQYGNLTVAIIHDLATEADKYGFSELSEACGQWLTNNWEKVSQNGQLSDMMKDETGGLFTQLMTLALRKK